MRLDQQFLAARRPRSIIHRILNQSLRGRTRKAVPEYSI
jgi:hypothetical protein